MRMVCSRLVILSEAKDLALSRLRMDVVADRTTARSFAALRTTSRVA